ncbi:MAG: archaellin/type IV pilin N-terminal domain-containing protein [Ignisphaera sp.]|nr:archaellin/type IV pilin N-terminal domain-containing protein [Ignisphaera sp.]
MRKLYRGIEPIIAVVILVAVTLVIAIGVVGWIMGWWGTFGATESLRIYPDSYINSSKLVLHLKNEGSATAVIYKIELTGGLAVQQRNITVTPGGEITETLDITTGNPIAGTRYQVSIYTRAGNVISATVQAR